MKSSNWRQWILWIVLTFVFVMFPLVSHAGGLGFAPLAAIAGIAGYLIYDQRPDLRAVPSVFYALAVFLIWAVVTSLWSPYEDPQALSNPVKLLLGVPIYCGVFLLGRHVGAKGREIIRHIILAACVLGLGILTIDLFSNYALTNFFDPINEGEHPLIKRNTNYMNLSHSVTVLALIGPVVVRLLWNKGVTGKMATGLWVIVLFICGLKIGIAAGLLAIGLGLFVMLMANRYPKQTIKTLIALAMVTLLFAPIMGYLMSFVPETVKASLSASWFHRVEIWAYAAEMIAEKPFFGHGFDAVRTFDRTFDFRELGQSNIMSLHPHNAGLHIWVETGLVGILLACMTLWFLGKFLFSYVDELPDHAPSIAGFLAAAIVICCLTYGIWQEWWWGVLFLLGAVISLMPHKFLMNNS